MLHIVSPTFINAEGLSRSGPAARFAGLAGATLRTWARQCARVALETGPVRRARADRLLSHAEIGTGRQ